MPTLQEVLQQAKTLPLEEQVTLAEFLLQQSELDRDAQKATMANEFIATTNPERPVTDFSLEHNWLKENSESYAGQYVCLDGDRLIAHGTSGREVLAVAKQAGVKVPFVTRIESSDDLPFGGW